MSHKFTIIITEDGKWFVSRCAELGVVSQGKTVEEAQKNLKEAVGLYLEDSPKLKKYAYKSMPLITSFELEYA